CFFGVYLIATSDDNTTGRGGWSLMGDDEKWVDMGLHGFVVQDAREENIELHFGTYGAYFKARGTDQPVHNNQGFNGTPYINAVEPTDDGVFAGLGPGKEGPTGLWFLRKGASGWIPIPSAEKDDIHTLAKSNRYVFAGSTTGGVIRVR